MVEYYKIRAMKVLDSEINLKENLLFSFTKYGTLWIILLVTIVFDYLTTLYFVSNLGPDAEANEVVAWLIRTLGVHIGVLVGKSLQLISVILFTSLSQRLGHLFLLVIILLNCWAVVVNTLPPTVMA